jgi:HKD family nuclease
MNNILIFWIKKWLHLSSDLVPSQLFDEKTFYEQFIKDLRHCKKEVIIESPFISSRRISLLMEIFQKLVDRKIKLYILTRNPQDHESDMRLQAESAIRELESMGIQVIINTDNSHRKLAILDQFILWEGSLNILSQTNSREYMRRIKSKIHSQESFKFINLDKYVY